MRYEAFTCNKYIKSHIKRIRRTQNFKEKKKAMPINYIKKTIFNSKSYTHPAYQKVK